MKHKSRLMIFGLALATASVCALPVVNAHDDATEGEEYFADRVRSDLPIYTFNYDELWPRRIPPEDDAIGCTSRVSFGDWEFKPATRSAADPYWVRLRNYGLFTCAALVFNADGRTELEEAEENIGFFARVGEEDADEPTREYWVLQEGTVPGSDYLLLAREMDEELVTKFTVLQRKCPIGALRSVLGMDSFRVSYCSINSHEDMLRFADEMAKLAPLGELILQPVLEEAEEVAP